MSQGRDKSRPCTGRARRAGGTARLEDAAALKSYEADLAIADRLAQSDPGNAGWQRDLWVSRNKIGEVLVAQGDLAGALISHGAGLDNIEALTRRDPANTLWQRDLSVSRNLIGDVQVAQGDLAGALKSYQCSLAIRDRLAKSDPGNAGWQRDLSVSYNKVGGVQAAQGDLAVSFGNLASVYRASADKAKARDYLRQGQAIIARLTKLSPNNAVWKQNLDWFDRQIAEQVAR